MDVYRNYTDVELTDLLRSGDHLAFTEIYKRYTNVLQGHAYSKLQDREEAIDLVQELFVSLWTKRESIVIHTTLSGYLYTAVRNRILNVILHKKVASDYITSLQDFIDHGEALTDHLVREKELRLIIEKEISALPEKMRAVFELSRKEGLSHKEIAEKLGLSEKTVKNQVNNSLKALKGKLGPLFVFLVLMN
ncbi:RNA polymerase sigma-70 factor [Pedobacter sp. MC2016-14]|uniref:RNA polymerase sigma-70 factor n=1 Tax=Pedobacter sp. MC2016-14 TaxID=2897327 RepID=UPI001E5F6D15|nr:RNA polymerase sigma-70 factor [Pedobacter sp. MC2016-14]MCD0488639.1 RNA polymerase sigma-70 factor [Pedobacter sp. MC2016-14]